MKVHKRKFKHERERKMWVRYYNWLEENINENGNEKLWKIKWNIQLWDFVLCLPMMMLLTTETNSTKC